MIPSISKSLLSLMAPGRYWLVLLILLNTALTGVQAAASETYRLYGTVSIGGEGNWDYLTVDSTAHRLYVSHGDRVEVVDLVSGKRLAEISDTPGVHGVALAREFEHGFTSNGDGKSVTMFDLTTLGPLKTIAANEPDFILYEAYSKRVFALNATTTVIDARTGASIGQVDLGSEPEEAASNNRGLLYVNLAKREAVAVVDVSTLKVVKTFPIERCTSPHSLSYDSSSDRLFVGCRNNLVVLDAHSGQVLFRTLMCSGVDGGGFDPLTHLIFQSCNEGVVSVIRQVTPDYYQLIDTVKTELWARTMAFDPVTKSIYLSTADVDLVGHGDATGGFDEKIRPGSFRVLVVRPEKREDRK